VSQYVPRPVVATKLPHLTADEIVAVDARRLALRHWRDKKLELARLEREPATLRHSLSLARSQEIDAAKACRDAGRIADEALEVED
jgi:hypothetical protein